MQVRFLHGLSLTVVCGSAIALLHKALGVLDALCPLFHGFVDCGLVFLHRFKNS